MGSFDKNQVLNELIWNLKCILKIKNITLDIGTWLLRVEKETEY